MLPRNRIEEEVRELLDALGEDRHGEAEEAVEPELFEHAGVQHGGGGRGGRRRLRGPGVEGEEGDEDAEAEEHEQVDRGPRREQVRRCELLEEADVEGAQFRGHREPDPDEAEQQDEAARAR
jgi:hypothetical protein